MNTYMKIVSVELINFARVYSGMGKTKIFINLLDTDNKINLFVGANGSGKTSIMGCCHPFAYNNATGDSTSNSNLIISGKDGKKTVVIQYGEDVYRIQHVYTRKKDGSITVKSYIMKNNEELNDSGLTTTFKTIIYDELGINETFLTLLSIGNRVNGFVEFTASDRKKFSTKLFSELGLFNEHYKVISSKTRKLKTLLNNVTMKLDKFKTTDRVKLELAHGDCIKSINVNDSKRISIVEEIGGIQTNLDNMRDISDEYKSLQNECLMLMTNIDNCRSRKQTSLSTDVLNTSLAKLIDDRNENSIQIATVSSNITNIINSLDTVKTELDKVQSKLDKMESLEDITDLLSIRANISDELNDLSKLDFNIVKNMDKSNLIRLQVLLNSANTICSKIIFDSDSQVMIGELFEEFKKDNTLYNKLDEKFSIINNKLQSYMSITSINGIDILLDKIGNDTNCEIESKCPYYTFYQSFVKIVNQSMEQTSADISHLRDDLHYISNNRTIVSIFRELFNFLNQDYIINYLPKGVLDINNCIYKFMDERTIYDTERLTYYIDLVEKLDRYVDLNKELSLINNKISNYNNTKSTIDEYNKMISEYNKTIEDLLKSQVEYDSKLEKLKSEAEDIDVKWFNINNDISLETEIDKYRYRLGLCNEQMSSMSDKISKLSDLESRLNILRNDKTSIDESIAQLNARRNQLELLINEYDSLKEEELNIKEDYDNILMIQDAVSPTKGIPVEFIEYVMRNEMIDKMNELLEPVYHGNFVLLKDEMVIDDSTFTIPYRKRNTVVNDISQASDGERAILTITFSLVLIELSLDKYNIMLLDEIDTSLDYHTRGKFLDLIEKYMSIIGSKQLFLISHNNMFDLYPVNVIMTSEQNISNMNHAHVIKLYE